MNAFALDGWLHCGLGCSLDAFLSKTCLLNRGRRVEVYASSGFSSESFVPSR
jgi:hypothetical protein